MSYSDIRVMPLVYLLDWIAAIPEPFPKSTITSGLLHPPGMTQLPLSATERPFSMKLRHSCIHAQTAPWDSVIRLIALALQKAQARFKLPSAARFPCLMVRAWIFRRELWL